MEKEKFLCHSRDPSKKISEFKMNEGYIIAAKDLPVDRKKKERRKIHSLHCLAGCDIVPIPYLRVSTPFQGAIINVLQLT